MDRVSPTTTSATAGRAMRIALIAPPYFPVPPPGYGGVERVIAVLARGLAEHGHEVTLVAAPGSAAPARIVTPLETAPLLGDVSAFTDELCHALTLYRRAGEFDVIHDHSGVGTALGAMLRGHPPVVHTLHGPWTDQAQRLYGLLDDRVALVAISHAQKAANPRVRYAGVVHNGIDMDLHPLTTKKEDYLVFVGRISPEKRPDVAIRVARQAGLPLKMIIKRSETAEIRYWEEEVVPLLGPDIEVMDQPPHHVKVRVVGRARAMLFPIAWPEPFGLVMTEAMACGTPVIARPLGAAPEVIDDGVSGFLCRTEQDMVEAVDAARGVDPAACRRVVERGFSGASMVRGYERIYRDLMAGSARLEDMTVTAGRGPKPYPVQPGPDGHAGRREVAASAAD